ncbi:MAG: tRNA (adenosine(37)-N6)-threonylcarbamoyltransferase complex ATPase subunit type 1 TsaE [Nitrospina sp.]|jgi:tRNA threonylcarbamoyladenosine biosynthesis protein TsaE|nr:tRNA (adenosine(37)-N6)-threonylcarbamoyltransferase complex ATPase subunit type 1 TsaE [Nitrospina sp.]MBT6718376.1 tRNA (adenosine(37)-N6)-threonylcarbamoyltransferase complex ATPase subunit type 1 TsaE [Nitrospina sp.]
MTKTITNNAEETLQLGIKLGAKLIEGDLVLLFGDLGAGKTCLTQGICRGAGLDNESYIRSPTFTLINEYQGKIPIFHIDLYRLETENEIINLGLEEIIYSKAITIIEWSEKLQSDKNPEEFKFGIHERLEIHIANEDESTREITFSPFHLAPRKPPLFPLL